MDKRKTLTEGIDFYYNEEGLMVLSREYLIRRGFCCQSGCTNCPYDFSRTIDPSIPLEFQTKFEDTSDTSEYDDQDDED